MDSLSARKATQKLEISSSKKNPLPLEFQKAASDIDMDIFWNHAFELQY